MPEKTIVISGKEYPLEQCELAVSNLKFYPENPRVYSVLNVSGQEPTQDEIFKVMITLESVKLLKEDIKKNGGLTDPLVVRGGDYVVLEGNSRLAAYHLLCQLDPIKWGKVKCEVLPADISEDAVFTLLGKYHIKGKANWEPYEQAGYLYRRQATSKTPIKKIAADLGISPTLAEKMTQAYKAMIDHSDLQKSRFSYYLEYYKSPDIKKVREKNPSIDEVVIQQIIDGRITNAQDIRKLGIIAKLAEKKQDKSAKKIIQDIIDETTDLYKGYDKLKDSGKLDDAYKTLNDFRTKIMGKSFEKELESADKDKVYFEMNKIQKRMEALCKKIKTQ